MSMEWTPGSHHGAKKSFNGCWTCKLRRKKCDEQHPVCDNCSSLHIVCHYDDEKPDWMDGEVKQEEMSERLKREIKENAIYRRRGERAVHNNSNGKLQSDLQNSIPEVQNTTREPCPESFDVTPQPGTECTFKEVRDKIPFGWSDTILLTFYLENLFPFLFPFYRPSLLQGGRAWILEMTLRSPVIRQVLLCQSSYFFSLSQGVTYRDRYWETLLAQTRDAFEVLRKSLQVIEGSNITEHMHGTVRIMASIMQVQRFEVIISSFENCQAHLNGALILFKQLLDSSGESDPTASFNNVLSRLAPSSQVLPAQCLEILSAEQSAFRFSSTLLIFDDIIASTVLQDQPQLYEYHHSLLGMEDSADPLIDLQAVVGCQNWVLLKIGEISTLEAWKKQKLKAGTLNVMELVSRASPIKDFLESHLSCLESSSEVNLKESNVLVELFSANHLQSESPTSQSSLGTRVWAHAALIYLFVVVSGWQPANIDVQYHVCRVIELLRRELSPLTLLRTMVWPFCVAGCLAEPMHEVHIRKIVESLPPSCIFGPVHKALEIMENVWSKRDVPGDNASRDIAMCFRSQGELVLLV